MHLPRSLALSLLILLLFATACGSSEETGAADPGPAHLDQSDLGVSTADALADTVADPGPGPDLGTDPGVGADPGGFNYPCEPGALRVCTATCGTKGAEMCLKDWGPCFPPNEFCGNCLDDDCDGLVNEGCLPNPACQPVEPSGCPVAAITIAEGESVGTGALLNLSSNDSAASAGESIVKWKWSVKAPVGSSAQFVPADDVPNPTFTVDVAGEYLFELEVWDTAGEKSCAKAQAGVTVQPQPPLSPEVGCSDGTREGFVALPSYTHVAGCAGAWSEPGITPPSVVPTCARQGGNDGPRPDGKGCSAPDLCAEGWHICEGWQEVAAKSPTGCAGSTPAGAKPKSLFFAIRQPSETNIVCGAKGSGFNDVFGCGNLGVAIPPDKGCGPLDRALASTQPGTCGFNEAEPPLGPWECAGGAMSHLNEGALVTKKACAASSCSYDGYPVGSSDKGGVLCCR